MKKTIMRRAAQFVPALANLHPVLHRVYAARGIQSMDELDFNLQRLLPYQSLTGVAAAARELAQAIAEQQRIVVIGDFDADGATSSALAVRALRSFGAQQVTYLVPNRFEYGYGLTREIVKVAAQRQPHLIITVDNGISSHEGVLAANEAGIKVIITDHHLPPPELPPALAIVNPQQTHDAFPSKNLAGVGVIFYVMLALRAELRERNWFMQQKIPEPNMTQFLDLVALGTVADLVPLDYNNRIMVHHGVQRIRSGKTCPGIHALFEVANRSSIKNCLASSLGYTIAPRLNAAGRLTDMSLGIECLLSEDLAHARHLAKQLDHLNQERRLIEQTMQQSALPLVDKLMIDAEKFSICLFDENWHQGVIGLLATRIKDRYNKPTIAFALGNSTEIKGSARSVDGLNMRDILENITVRYPGLIIKFGGHAMAAGLSLTKSSYLTFTQAFEEEVKRRAEKQTLSHTLYTDGELDNADFCLSFAKQLYELNPWGQGFPEPLFDGYFNVVDRNLINNKHLKLKLKTRQSPETYLDGIAFNIDTNSHCYQQTDLQIAYRLKINEYAGRENVNLVIEEIRDT